MSRPSNGPLDAFRRFVDLRSAGRRSFDPLGGHRRAAAPVTASTTTAADDKIRAVGPGQEGGESRQHCSSCA